MSFQPTKCPLRLDPHAFVTQSQVMGVFGEGFDKFKIKNKNNKKHLETISLEEK